MCELSGPVDTLPGASHPLPEGTVCEEHPDRKAFVRVQGETDSFGCEYIDMCKECYTRSLVVEVDTSGKCEWCKTDVEKRVDARDYEEGTNGRVYSVCEPCKRRQTERLQDELEYCYD